MQIPLTSPTRARVKPLSRLALGLTLGFAPLAIAQNAIAQNAIAQNAIAQNAIAQNAPVTPPTVSANGAAPAAVTVAPNISILIVALDDLSAPDATTSLIPQTAINPAAANPIAPIAPADGAPANVTPTAFEGQLWQRTTQWRALAQKKSKEQKKRDKEAEDKIFNINPVAPTPYTPPGARQPVVPNVIVPGATGLGVGVPTIVRAPADPLASVPVNADTTPASKTPGRSQLMAVSLRRVLIGQGYKDVQVVTPESSTIIRAIGEARLSNRVLEELQRSLAILAANNAAGVPPDVGATIAAGRAASRIGQATGYRAVVGFHVADPTDIGLVGVGAAPDAKTQKISVNMVVADAQRESVEPLQYVETGDGEAVWRETGAAAGANSLGSTLHDWPANSTENRVQLAQVHFKAAQAAFDRGDLTRAQDELNQSLSLDSSSASVYLLRGDILKAIDPNSAALAYRRAVEVNSQNGQDWARIAAAYAYAKTPDWPSARNAAERALALNYDSAQLRVVLATVQYGRAELFRQADYPGKAEEAESDARSHLERALQLSPDDPTAVRLLAKNLIDKRRFEEAARTLDRIAPRYPDDLEIQGQYAVALGNQIGREADAFAAYSRVWKLSRQKTVLVDAITYRTLASGFDQRLFDLGKVAIQLSRGVASRAVLRETALLQLSKLKEEMEDAKAAITVMQPAGGVTATAVTSRIFAASLMDQSLESFQTYLETGQNGYFKDGDNLYRNAVASLNSARSTQ